MSDRANAARFNDDVDRLQKRAEVGTCVDLDLSNSRAYRRASVYLKHVKTASFLCTEYGGRTTNAEIDTAVCGSDDLVGGAEAKGVKELDTAET